MPCTELRPPRVTYVARTTDIFITPIFITPIFTTLTPDGGGGRLARVDHR